MSNESPKAGGYSPAGKLTVDQFREIADIIKGLLANEPAIKWSIIAAGVGGALESIHLLWLFARFVYQSLK